MKSNEWYTPAKYIEAARQVMGRIDLDPASCEDANLTVKAARYYDKTSNGLMQPWRGCVWLNPPFSDESTPVRRLGGEKKGYSVHFVRKLLQEYQSGNVDQAVLLVMAKVDTRWFRALWSYPICFSDHKVMFFRPGQAWESNFFGTCFVYLGPHEDRFIDIFSRFGTVARRVSVPKPTPITLELF